MIHPWHDVSPGEFLPKEVVEREKQGFSAPDASWFKGESIDYVLRELRLAYLVPSSGGVDVNGVRIRARDGVAIKDVDLVTITAIEDADVVMVDVH